MMTKQTMKHRNILGLSTTVHLLLTKYRVVTTTSVEVMAFDMDEARVIGTPQPPLNVKSHSSTTTVDWCATSVEELGDE